MTYEKFLVALRKTGGWRLEQDGVIRRGGNCGGAQLGFGSECPLMAIFPPEEVYHQPYSRSVYRVADNWENTENFEDIRRDLFKACHLES